MLAAMYRVMVVMMLLLAMGLKAAESVYILSAAEWAGPRSGARVLQMDGVRAAVQEMNASNSRGLLLRYPGGDEGSLWVEELRSWLLTLGVEPQRIEMRPGSPAPDIIEMEVLHGVEQ